MTHHLLSISLVIVGFALSTEALATDQADPVVDSCEQNLLATPKTSKKFIKLKPTVEQALLALFSRGQRGNAHGALLNPMFPSGEVIEANRQDEDFGVKSWNYLGARSLRDSLSPSPTLHHVFAIETNGSRFVALRIAEWKEAGKAHVRLLNLNELSRPAVLADGFIGFGTIHLPLLQAEDGYELIFEAFGRSADQAHVAMVRILKDGKQITKAPIEMQLLKTANRTAIFQGVSSTNLFGYLKFKLSWNTFLRKADLDLIKVTGPRMLGQEKLLAHLHFQEGSAK